ncbi:hypothetical protein BKA57DRAFT_438812 [Linnemannia elongata]|nr:hypothetical protein BKA57DRAFT_438812 [Linnemannia elongata]
MVAAGDVVVAVAVAVAAVGEPGVDVADAVHDVDDVVAVAAAAALHSCVDACVGRSESGDLDRGCSALRSEHGPGADPLETGLRSDGDTARPDSRRVGWIESCYISLREDGGFE